ncbi:MAG: DUF5110 domain-containing protein [Clostridia bacterium]|nr:DUF5110 domain-containing protein [Clostridia bacterium]
MDKLNNYLIWKTTSHANQESIAIEKDVRFTVLTDKLIRVEVQKDQIFCDEPTQEVINRAFNSVEFQIQKTKTSILISTETRIFSYDIHSKRITFVNFLDKDKWVKCNNKKNLKGTTRTLDMKNGRVKLGNGILSKSGVSYFDDNSLVLIDGVIQQRKAPEIDTYVFAYGDDYQEALNDYFKLTGKAEMLPKYVLSNWWSRYHKYSQQEYTDLMLQFEKEKIPFTVATIDMDWHWVDVKEKFGYTKKSTINPLITAGWTGYSFNTDLFPNYKEFFEFLHNHGLSITLNLHPRDGVRPFEDMYDDMCKELGLDPQKKEDIEFDITDPKYINAYFKVLHNPYEKDGVDFWWIDWQQGTKSKLKGLDPLWALNHYHTLDIQRDNKRGVVLSRFCGIGAQRYPLGFSGDAITSFKSLKFQPEYTNRASNIGYNWWSHDIGGHQLGSSNDELYLRWVQYGVFSPINRLHSSQFDLQGKEPWNRSETVKRIAIKYLRLRHKMLPYIYTAAHTEYEDNIPICQPLYHRYPKDENAYNYNNEYYFGGKMLVIPITSKVSKSNAMAHVKGYLPDNSRYTDFFTNQIYKGKGEYTFSRDLEYMPILCKEGTIIPLSEDEGNRIDNPTNLHLIVFRGNGVFVLYEDDGLTNEFKKGKFAETLFEITEENNEIIFKVNKVEGDTSVLPLQRKYTIEFRDVVDGTISIDGKELTSFTNTIEIDADYTKDNIIKITNAKHLTNGDNIENAKRMLSRDQGRVLAKQLKFMKLRNIKDDNQFKEILMKTKFSKATKLAALEMFQNDKD